MVLYARSSNNTILINWLTRKPLLTWISWFFGGNVLLFWLIGLRYVAQIVPLPLSRPNFISECLAWLTLILAYVGQLALLALFPALLVAVLILIAPQRRFIFITSIVLATSPAIILLIDTLVFAQFRFHLNGVVLAMFFSRQGTQIFDFSWLEWLFTGCLVGSLLIAESCYAVFVWQTLQHKLPLSLAKRGLVTLMACLLFSFYLFTLAGVYPGIGINKEAYALPLYANFYSRLLPISNSFNRVIELGAGNFAQFGQANGHLHYPLHPLICHAPQKPLNIVIIAIDSWRFDMVNPSNMPQLSQFAQSSWVFAQHYSGGNATEPGIFSLFYGLPATYWTATLRQHRSPLLIDELLQQHYQTGVFASAELKIPAFNKNVFSHIPNLQVTTPGATPFDRDRYITAEFQQFVNHTAPSHKPFFVFLFYDAPHSYCFAGNSVARFQPAIKTCNRLVLFDNTDPVPYFNRYKNAVYFDDALIGQDLAALKQQGLLNNTVVIFTGDHGQEFNDNHLGYWEHSSNFTHYQVQTPLVVYWPKQPPAVFNYQTSHYDIAPTLLTQLLGCQNPANDYSIGGMLTNKSPPAYLLVNSYINFGIIEPTRITNVFPTGDYTIDDLSGRPIPNAKLHATIFMQALSEMKKYFM